MKAESVAQFAEEQKKHNMAKNSGSTSCQQCGYCCLQQPCVPEPGEFEAIARFLGMEPAELAQKYTVVNEDKKGYFLLWIRETQGDIAGKYIPYYRTYDRGYCVFFDKENHECKIHSVRPKSAKSSVCWENPTITYNGIWPVHEIQKLLPDFDPNGGKYVYKTNEIGLPCKVRVA
ncbi:YkgJ family cysteine cluster protein [Dehalogenimonas sp. THU2]|uniref:YkgJ family cysteine cluster protein n=1 Tax=Dehalogenimonas sp. THU2 TaxID=3151121 RepID=UPI0032185A98